jgi:hypothetical protein
MHRSSGSALPSQARQRHLPWQWAGVLFVALLALYSCGGQSGQDLPFTSIEQGSASPPNTSTPAIFVIANDHEIEAVAQSAFGVTSQSSTKPSPGQQTVEHLRQIDYTQSVAILTLQGLQGTPNGITIRQIVLKDNQVLINATLVTPVRWYDSFLEPIIGRRVRQQMASNPYHLITISKESIRGKQLLFELIDASNVVAENARTIP